MGHELPHELKPKKKQVSLIRFPEAGLFPGRLGLITQPTHVHAHTRIHTHTDTHPHHTHMRKKSLYVRYKRKHVISQKIVQTDLVVLIHI